MVRRMTERGALTIGQLARRWGVGVERVRQLLKSGHLPGAFTIPSAGRYGETTKIPLATVTALEQRWAVADETPQALPRLKPRKKQQLRHFPELGG